MKKYLTSILVLGAVILGSAGVVQADDGGPNPVFWVKSNRVTCISVIDPENIKKDSFLVFDYSPNIGQSRGKPWTILEKGKCYELDKDGGTIYRVQIVNGTEREQFSNYSAYKPTDDIPQLFCKDHSFCTFDEPISNVSEDLFGYEIVTLDRSDRVFDSRIRANNVFPTQYDFGDPVTSYTSSPSQSAAAKDPSFIKASTLYKSLADGLEGQLQSCDTRVRVEYQTAVDTENNSNLTLKNLVWRLSNNQDVALDPEKVDPLQLITIMGCQTTFINYIQSHKADFDTIDSLIKTVVKKYPSAVGNNYDQPLKKRDPSILNKIVAFATTPIGPTTPKVAEIPQKNTSVISTTLDEPTPEKKADILIHSKNPLMQVYIVLPITALIGMIIFLLLKKRKK